MKRRLLIAAAALGVVLALAAVAYPTMRAAQRYEAAGDAFLNALRAGDQKTAYQLLSARRRARMSFEEFVPYASHVAFAKSSAHGFRRNRTFGLRPTAGCARGELTVDGREWALEIYFVRGEGDAFYVDAFGVQEPASAHLAELLEECGADRGTKAGYNGPPVVNRPPSID